MICTDELRLQQVLMNFQSNALKFTPNGGTISIVCKLIQEEHEDGAIQISVVDTGIGISETD